MQKQNVAQPFCGILSRNRKEQTVKIYCNRDEPQKEVEETRSKTKTKTKQPPIYFYDFIYVK